MRNLVRWIVIQGLLALGTIAAMAVFWVFSASAEIEKVQVEELKKMIENKADMVVVDNQPKVAYDMGHIPGAINFPWATEIKRPAGLPRDKVLILYCACQHEEDATDVANKLMENFGYKKIKLLEGGWLKWIKLGYPVEKSKGK
jgi:rhodanese-related sulfurtransferase